MAKNKILKSVRINKEILAKIEDDLGQGKYTFSDLVNAALLNFIESENLEKLGVKDFIYENHRDKKIGRIYFSKREFEVLENRAKMHGFASASKEAKFIVINAIYKKSNFFNNTDMTELKNARNDLNALGRNLHQVLKYLRENNLRNFTFNYEKFGLFVKQIAEQVGETANLINHYNEVLQLKVL
ncbi:MAG: hypothetical protein K5978_04675 [Campylobacter sp.]|nr:hypothetical protein [Campylobacter sp.]